MAEPNYYAHTAAENQDKAQAAARTEEEKPAADSDSAFDLSFLQWYTQNSGSSVYSTPSAPLHAGYSLNVPLWNTEEE